MFAKRITGSVVRYRQLHARKAVMSITLSIGVIFVILLEEKTISNYFSMLKIRRYLGSIPNTPHYKVWLEADLIGEYARKPLNRITLDLLLQMGEKEQLDDIVFINLNKGFICSQRITRETSTSRAFYSESPIYRWGESVHPANLLIM